MVSKSRQLVKPRRGGFAERSAPLRRFVGRRIVVSDAPAWRAPLRSLRVAASRVSMSRGDRLAAPEHEVGLRRLAAGGLHQGRDLPAVVVRVSEQLCENIFDAVAEVPAVQAAILEL